MRQERNAADGSRLLWESEGQRRRGGTHLRALALRPVLAPLGEGGVLPVRGGPVRGGACSQGASGGQHVGGDQAETAGRPPPAACPVSMPHPQSASRRRWPGERPGAAAWPRAWPLARRCRCRTAGRPGEAAPVAASRLPWPLRRPCHCRRDRSRLALLRCVRQLGMWGWRSLHWVVAIERGNDRTASVSSADARCERRDDEQRMRPAAFNRQPSACGATPFIARASRVRLQHGRLAHATSGACASTQRHALKRSPPAVAGADRPADAVRAPCSSFPSRCAIWRSIDHLTKLAHCKPATKRAAFSADTAAHTSCASMHACTHACSHQAPQNSSSAPCNAGGRRSSRLHLGRGLARCTGSLPGMQQACSQRAHRSTRLCTSAQAADTVSALPACVPSLSERFRGGRDQGGVEAPCGLPDLCRSGRRRQHMRRWQAGRAGKPGHASC